MSKYIEQTLQESLAEAYITACHILGRNDEARNIPATRDELEKRIRELNAEIKGAVN